MRDDRQRWERVCAVVKERGARIRRRRQIVAGVSMLVVLFVLAAVPFGLKRDEKSSERLALLGETEIEVMLIEHDIVFDDMGIY